MRVRGRFNGSELSEVVLLEELGLLRSTVLVVTTFVHSWPAAPEAAVPDHNGRWSKLLGASRDHKVAMRFLTPRKARWTDPPLPQLGLLCALTSHRIWDLHLRAVV